VTEISSPEPEVHQSIVSLQGPKLVVIPWECLTGTARGSVCNMFRLARQKYKFATQVSFLVCSASSTQVGPTEMRRSGRYIILFNADKVTFVTGMNTELRTPPTTSRSVNYHATLTTIPLELMELDSCSCTTLLK